MALRRFKTRAFCLLLVCITLIFWLINVLDWTHMDEVTTRQSSKLKLISNSDRSLFNKVMENHQLNSDSHRTANSTRNYSTAKHPWLFPRPLSELEDKVVPNQVFFIWCQNQTFTFNDYLSVLSVWKLLEPDKLEIHTAADTAVKTDNYNQWFLELNRTVPVFKVDVIKHRRKSICRNYLYYALEVLNDRGGVFMDFSTVLLQPLHDLRNQNFSIGFNELGKVSFIMSGIKNANVSNVLISRADDLDSAQTLSMLKDFAMHAELCPTLSSSLPLVLSKTKTRKQCMTLSAGLQLTPLSLRQIENQELTILRDLYYLRLGREQGCADAHQKKTPIPFIVHYVWFGSSDFSFRMYLCFLSTVHIAKAERVFIHSDLRLKGYYWKIVSAHPIVTLVYREIPREIYGHRVLYAQHFSDVVRADVLDKYGGIYLDWDVLWLQSPARLLTSGHEAIVDLDHMPRPFFPEVLNLGVFLAAPRACFVRLWRWELRNYQSMDFYYNALELPFKVFERHPDTLFIEKRLQVMCFWLKCHPIFHPDHKDWNRAQPFDWRTDVYSIHFTHPDPKEYDSIVDLLNANGTFAEMGKFILEASGELDIK